MAENPSTPDVVVTILYFDGCPNWDLARQRTVEAIRTVGISATIAVQRVESPEQAERTGFAGSPTILIDGRDPFPSNSIGFACRLYGDENSPSVADLVLALGSWATGGW